LESLLMTNQSTYGSRFIPMATDSQIPARLQAFRETFPWFHICHKVLSTGKEGEDSFFGTAIKKMHSGGNPLLSLLLDALKLKLSVVLSTKFIPHLRRICLMAMRPGKHKKTKRIKD
jgi:hypothetical protein